MISSLWGALAAMSIGAPALASPALSCSGALSQSGLLVCEAEGLEAIKLADGTKVKADTAGRVVVGVQQHADTNFKLTPFFHDGTVNPAPVTLDLASREDDYRVLEGLDCDKVDARSQEQKDHAGRSWLKKQAAFKTFNEGVGPFEGFIRPAEGRTSSPFGPTRKYTGVSKVTGEPCDSTSVHRGYDIAAPVGTPIIAPASGTVVLADPDLYYEGGTIFLDHGYGLISVFMHMSAVDVAAGDEVDAGDLLGKVGNTGRTTGPHLHWAVKWRNPSSDDRGGDFYIDPALLLELPVTAASE